MGTPEISSTGASKPWDAEEAFLALQGGASEESVAASYGLSLRALRVRVGKHSRSRGASSVLHKYGAQESNTSPNSPTPDSSSNPVPPQEDATKAIEDLARLITPEVLVSTIDAGQQGSCALALWLADVEVSNEARKKFAFSDMENAMLQPWAGFLIQKLPDMLRTDPSLGLKIGGALLVWVLGLRAVMVASTIKRAQEHKAQSARAKVDETAPSS